MNRNKFLIRKKAFTLSELIIGLGLLALILLTVIGVFTGGLCGAKKSDRKITAVTLAESMIDTIMLMSYNEIPYGSYPPSVDPAGKFPPSPYPEEPSNDFKGKYIYSVIVKDIPGTGGNLKSITVTVTTMGILGEGDTGVTLTTYKAR
ncbi:MAG: hypothetical protein ABRQ37_14815 [Candidatus Eremiobacterota bacterium]